mmetsp:Transcript_45176/g.109331  ORF Transcript_45176/g.109331 Transcript_45176/m.109331 type:complete len:203 (+) Transcript_45176:176-784(+)
MQYVVPPFGTRMPWHGTTRVHTVLVRGLSTPTSAYIPICAASLASIVPVQDHSFLQVHLNKTVSVPFRVRLPARYRRIILVCIATASYFVHVVGVSFHVPTRRLVSWFPNPICTETAASCPSWLASKYHTSLDAGSADCSKPNFQRRDVHISHESLPRRHKCGSLAWPPSMKRRMIRLLPPPPPPPQTKCARLVQRIVQYHY